MTPSDTDLTTSASFLLYQTEDGQTRVQCRLEDETLWLTQAQMAELFQTSVPNIESHLKTLFEEGELREEATIQDYLIVRTEGNRSVSRDVKHYRLEAVLAVGFRVRSHRGTQFRPAVLSKMETTPTCKDCLQVRTASDLLPRLTGNLKQGGVEWETN